MSQSRAKGIHITMRDGFVWRCLRNNKDTINVVEGRTVDENKKEDSVAVVIADGESAPLYDGIRLLYRHTRQAAHYSVMELHPSKASWVGICLKSVIGVLARS